MKIKYTFIVLNIILLLISISQIFSIPPFAANVFPVYKSGYFRELDRGFEVITDSFLNIKMMRESVANAWIFVNDIQEKHKMKISIYDYRGMLVPAPGETKNGTDENVQKILNSLNPEEISQIKNKKYYSAIPVFLEDRCMFCHTGNYKKNIAGIITFEREFDSLIYYTSERVLIFIGISLVLIILLCYIIRWDPGKAVKELFDKK